MAVAMRRGSDGLRVPLPPVDFDANTAALEAPARHPAAARSEEVRGVSVDVEARDKSAEAEEGPDGSGDEEKEAQASAPPRHASPASQRRAPPDAPGSPIRADVHAVVQLAGRDVRPLGSPKKSPGAASPSPSISAAVDEEEDPHYHDLVGQLHDLEETMDRRLSEVKEDVEEGLRDFQRHTIARLVELQAAFMVEADLGDGDYQLVTQLRLHNDMVCRFIFDELKNKREWMEGVLKSFTRAADATHRESLAAQTSGFQALADYLRKDHRHKLDKVRASIKVEVESRMRLDRALLASQMRKLERLHQQDLEKQRLLLGAQVETLERMNGQITHQRNNAEKKITELQNAMSFIAVVLNLRGPDGEIDLGADVAADAVQEHARRVEELEATANRARGKQKTIKDLRDQIERLKRASKAQREGLDRARAEATKAEAAREEAQKAAARSREELAEANKREAQLKVDLKMKVDEVKNLQLEEQRKYEEKLNAERANWKDKVEALQRNLLDKEMEVRQAKQDVVDAEQRGEVNSKAVHELEQANAEMMQEMERLRAIVGGIERDALVDKNKLLEAERAAEEARKQAAKAREDAEAAREDARSVVGDAAEKIAELESRPPPAPAFEAGQVVMVAGGSADARAGLTKSKTMMPVRRTGPDGTTPRAPDDGSDSGDQDDHGMPIPEFRLRLGTPEAEGAVSRMASIESASPPPQITLSEEEVEAYKERQREELRGVVFRELQATLAPQVEEEIRREFARGEAARVRADLRKTLVAKFKARLEEALNQQRERFSKEFKTVRLGAVKAVKRMKSAEQRLADAEKEAAAMRQRAQISAEQREDYELQLKEKELLLSQMTVLTRAYRSELEGIERQATEWDDAELQQGYAAAQASMLDAAMTEGDEPGAMQVASRLSDLPMGMAPDEEDAAGAATRSWLADNIARHAAEDGVETSADRARVASRRMRRTRSAGGGVAAARAKRAGGPQWASTPTTDGGAGGGDHGGDLDRDSVTGAWADGREFDGASVSAGRPSSRASSTRAPATAKSRRPVSSKERVSTGSLPPGVRRASGASAPRRSSSTARLGDSSRRPRSAAPAVSCAGGAEPPRPDLAGLRMDAHVRTQLRSELMGGGIGVGTAASDPIDRAALKRARHRRTVLALQRPGATRGGTQSAPASRPGSAGVTAHRRPNTRELLSAAADGLSKSQAVAVPAQSTKQRATMSFGASPVPMMT